MLRSKKYAQDACLNFTKKINCYHNNNAETLKCLQNKTMNDIADAAGNNGNPFTTAGWGPVTDGIVFTESPLKMLVTGNFPKFYNLSSVIAGTNTNEGTMFVYPYYLSGMTKKQYHNFIDELLNGKGTQKLNSTELVQFNKLYNATSTSDNRQLASSVMADGTFICGTRFYLRYISRHYKNMNTYKGTSVSVSFFCKI